MLLAFKHHQGCCNAAVSDRFIHLLSLIWWDDFILCPLRASPCAHMDCMKYNNTNKASRVQRSSRKDFFKDMAVHTLQKVAMPHHMHVMHVS